MRIGISSPASFRNTLHYHERKVRSGKAQLILAGNFLKEAAELTIEDKIRWFERLHGLNNRVHFPTFHVFISFNKLHDLTSAQMAEIAAEYLQHIGFGDQPFLVYRHMDTGVPHLHIVSSIIRYNGDAIRTHRLGLGKSLSARNLLMERYNLRTPPAVLALDQGPIQRLNYGKTDVETYVDGVLSYVLSKYAFASLTELNAVLTLYNVQADPGLPGGRIHTYRGLTYHMVDEEGRRIGKPIAARKLPAKATLATLEQFALAKKPAYLQLTTNLQGRIQPLPGAWPDGWPALAKRLNKLKIRVLPLLNQEGAFYDAVFIDLDKHAAIAASRLSATNQNAIDDFRDCRTIAADIVRAFNILNKVPEQEVQSQKQQRNLRK